MQVLDIIARIKNVEADHRALGGAEDVGEAETALCLYQGRSGGVANWLWLAPSRNQTTSAV